MRLIVLLAAGLWFGVTSAQAGGEAAAGNAYFGEDVRAEGIGGTLDLADQNGRRRSLEEFRGKVVLIFFGYTRCPDVCPTTLSRMARVMKLLGPDADKAQVLWVTVDPERDTRALLRNYVLAFNPKFIALRGTPAQTKALTEAFHVSYQILKYQGSVLVDHSAYGYLIDAVGRTRLKLPYDMTAEQIAADIEAILRRG